MCVNVCVVVFVCDSYAFALALCLLVLSCSCICVLFVLFMIPVCLLMRERNGVDLGEGEIGIWKELKEKKQSEYIVWKIHF